MKITLVFSALAFLLTWAACSSPQSSDRDAKPIALRAEPFNPNDEAVQDGASHYTEIKYEKGSAKLHQDDFAAISDLIQKSMRDGKIDEIKVMTWSDQPTATRGNRSSYEERRVADARNSQIRNYLKETYPSIEANFYNMSARPEVVRDLFKGSDASAKRTFEEAGIVSLRAPENTASQKGSRSVLMSIVKRTY